MRRDSSGRGRPGIETLYLDHRGFPTREDYDRAARRPSCARGTCGWCAWRASCACSAPRSSRRFPNAILNIHPALLPAFPGLDAQHQAWAYGAKISGATVHLVTPELDAGPIILQAAVPVRDDDTAETLAARILVEEHRLYPEAIRIVLDGSWTLVGPPVHRDRVGDTAGPSGPQARDSHGYQRR